MLIKIASDTLSYARHELDLIGMTANNKDAMNREMRKDILELIEKFSKQGHSGFSAGYAINILSKLLKHKPLSPLKGTDDEWVDISDRYGTDSKIKHYQNERCSSVFKETTLKGKIKSVYDVDGIHFKDKSGAIYTSKDSRVPVTFPYTPKTVIKNESSK